MTMSSEGIMRMSRRAAAPAGALALALLLLPGQAGAQVAGAGYTTFDAVQGGCLDSPNGIDCNNYRAKGDVYMSGGPTGGGGLSDGAYYFAVLAPGSQNGGFADGASGNLSDTTRFPKTTDRGSGDPLSNRTFTVSGGLIASYGGTHATGTSPNGKFIVQLMPYDNTPNSGGVYILAICRVGATSPKDCKYDAFKVKGSPKPVDGTVQGLKYYDANDNGQWDAGEPGIPGWLIDYSNGTAATVTTGTSGTFSLSLPAPDSYHFAERQAGFPWVESGNKVDQTSTTGSSFAQLNVDMSYDVTIADGSTVSGLNFGNVCVVPTGGHTMGFWSNPNGQALIDESDLQALRDLHLRNADGSDFDPYSKDPEYRNWLLGANAVNMAYMLSAQLSALALDERHGLVSAEALIFGDRRTIGQIIADADALLAADGYTPDGDANRAAQEAIKNLIDAINNNNPLVVPPTPGGCPTPIF